MFSPAHCTFIVSISNSHDVKYTALSKILCKYLQDIGKSHGSRTRDSWIFFNFGGKFLIKVLKALMIT